MKFTYLTTSILSIVLMVGCAQADATADKAAEAAQASLKDAAAMAKDKMAPGADISAISSGTYKADAGHAYIAFSYDHQGYSKPILRWNKFDATVNLDSDNPENSTVSVSIDAKSVDSGVDVWDKKLVSSEWFDAGKYPNITFTSTGVDQTVLGQGYLDGNLTIKDVTKPVRLHTTLNKAGQHFRRKTDMFGVSATADIKRADFGLTGSGSNAPEIHIMVEIEFQKQ